jgi:hypothetical protein
MLWVVQLVQRFSQRMLWGQQGVVAAIVDGLPLAIALAITLQPALEAAILSRCATYPQELLGAPQV